MKVKFDIINYRINYNKVFPNMTIWTPFAFILLPLAFVIFFLICLPLPIKLNKYIIYKIVTLGNIKIPYTKFSIIQTIISISIIMFIIATSGLIKYQKIDNAPYNIIGAYALKWRSERNLWLCLCNLMMYLCIYVILSLKYKIINYEDEKNNINKLNSPFKNNYQKKSINSLRIRTKYPGDLLSR